MSALYLGTGKLEKYLLERLSSKVETTPNLKFNMVLDYMRGTRVNRDGVSSYSMMKGFKESHFTKNVRVGFFHHPDTGLLKGKYSSGPMKEIFGVHHIKSNVFDNNVIITG